MKARLSPAVARTDLTDRECTKIIGGLLGGLIQLSTPRNLRNAIRWWADTDEAWNAFERFLEARDEVMKGDPE